MLEEDVEKNYRDGELSKLHDDGVMSFASTLGESSPNIPVRNPVFKVVTRKDRRSEKDRVLECHCQKRAGE